MNREDHPLIAHRSEAKHCEVLLRRLKVGVQEIRVCVIAKGGATSATLSCS